MNDSPVIVQRVYAAKGDPAAADQLIREYLPFIRVQAGKVLGRIPVEGRDDEMSIAMFAFHEAVEGCSKRKGAFMKFAALIIRRRLIDYHRKEVRHSNQMSLDAPAYGDEDGATGMDLMPDPKDDDYDKLVSRQATRAEITELTTQLDDFGLALSDIVENCPRQERTLKACQAAVQYARDNPQLADELKRTRRLPINRLAEGSGVARKTLERHRKYILVLMLIYSNGYELIRGHLRQVFAGREGR